MVAHRGEFPRYPYLWPPELAVALARRLRSEGFSVTELRPIRTPQGYAYKPIRKGH